MEGCFVADADAGDSSALQQLFDDYVRFQTSGSTEALFPIWCLDWQYRGDSPVPIDLPEQLEHDAPLWSSLFPAPPMRYRTGRSNAPYIGAIETSGDLCERWPIDPEPITDPLTAESAGPIMVLTATDEIITPPGLAEHLSDQLVDDVLIYVEAAEHASYNRFGGLAQRCAVAYVDRFLIDLERPADRTVCPADPQDDTAGS